MIVVRVIICTHNPDIDKLFLCFLSVKNQIIEGVDLEVLIVNNGTESSKTEIIKTISQSFMFESVHLEEANLTKSRICGIKHKSIKKPDIYLFVDDDNYLNDDYVSIGTATFQKYPEVGVLAGKALTLKGFPQKRNWAKQYLAIRDLGEYELFGKEDKWEQCDPHGAGMFVNRQTASIFVNKFETTKNLDQLGRSGNNLNSGEDSFIVRLSKSAGFVSCYNPLLKLYHDVNPQRLKFPYLMRLARGMGRADSSLEIALKESPQDWVPKNLMRLFRQLVYEIRVVGIEHALFKVMRSYARRSRKNY